MRKKNLTKQEGGKRPSFIVLLLGSFGFTGYVPFASGTVGSLLALAVYWVLPFTENGTILTLMALTMLFIGVPVAQRLEDYYGKDPSVVVLDEAVGMWLALIFLPKVWWIALAAFFIFRLFDITKPQPARYFDRRSGGAGIMLDDVIAGLYTNIVLHITLLFF